MADKKPESKAVKTRKEFEKIQAGIEAERERRRKERQAKAKAEAEAAAKAKK